MKIHVVWMVLPALLLTGAFVDRTMERQRHRAELARLDEKLVALTRVTDELEARVDALGMAERHLELRMVGQAGAATRGGTPVAPPPPSPASTAATSNRTPDEPAPDEGTSALPSPDPATLVRTLDQAFATEALDAPWSAATDSAMRGRLATLTNGHSALRSLECRSSMCRLEVVHDDAQQSSEFAQHAFTGEGAPLWVGTYVQTRLATPDGKQATVAYLVREGRELPRLE